MNTKDELEMRHEEFIARARAAGHVLRLNEDGHVDLFVENSFGHNGPGCVVCGQEWCVHCNPKVEPCTLTDEVLSGIIENAAKHIRNSPLVGVLDSHAQEKDMLQFMRVAIALVVQRVR